jgi:hypothetical protein
VAEPLQHVVLDPQTSGGLALFSSTQLDGAWEIGRAVEGEARIVVH